MNTKFCVGESVVCPCDTILMTVEHLLQDCPTYQNLRTKIRPADQPLREKLYGSLESLWQTTAFISESGVPIWANDNEEEEEEDYVFVKDVWNSIVSK